MSLYNLYHFVTVKYVFLPVAMIIWEHREWQESDTSLHQGFASYSKKNIDYINQIYICYIRNRYGIHKWNMCRIGLHPKMMIILKNLNSIFVLNSISIY